MTARPIGVEVSCDGPDSSKDCPDSAAVRASFTSVTARQVRADGKAQGWTRRRRDGRLVDLCPGCDGPARATPVRPSVGERSALHLGGKANAEDCPGCKAELANLPYPFLCPAEPAAVDTTTKPAKVPCTAVHVHLAHDPHWWEPQPDMDLVRCLGYRKPEPAPEA